MNRFQYDNIDESLTAQERERALKPKGINAQMSKDRRAKKHARHATNKRDKK